MNEVNIELRSAVKAIKAAILQSQYRAAKAVNREQLSLYFGIGKYVSENSRKGFWGTWAIENISEQLHKELPGLRGFSSASIKKMRIFYEQWAFIANRSPLANETVPDEKSLAIVSEIGEVDYTELANINRSPFGDKGDVGKHRR